MEIDEYALTKACKVYYDAKGQWADMTIRKCVEAYLEHRRAASIRPVRKTRIIIERRRLDLPIDLFNEAAKQPYKHLFKSSTIDKLIFAALDKVGLEPKSSVTDEMPLRFDSIIVNVPIKEEYYA